MNPGREVSLPHPIVDEHGPGWVSTRATDSLVRLSSGREALFIDGLRFGARVVLVTHPRSRISFALYQHLTALNGVWLTYDHVGSLRHAVGGETVEKLSLVTEPGYVPVATVPAEQRLNGIGAREDATELRPWLQFTVASHHSARLKTDLGGVAHTLIESITGTGPVAWGASEPVTIPWDRPRLTALARVRMPQDTRVYVNGEGGGIRYSGSIRAYPSDNGVTEETRLVFALDDTSASVIDRAAAVCESMAESEQILFGTAWVTRGAADATILPYWPTTPRPLAAVIGARTVRSMKLNTEQFLLNHDARVVGRRRSPSLVVNFGAEGVRWQHFARDVGSRDSENLTAFLTPPMVRNAS